MIRLIFGILWFLGKIKSQDACKRPIYNHLESRTCTGKGDCKKNARGLDFCECRLYDRDGYKGYENQGGKRYYGKWCQCNPWNCLNYQLSRDSKVTSNYLIIKRE